MNDERFLRRFTEAMRPGSYLRIVNEGDVGAGDEVRVVEKPDTDLTVRDVFRIYTRDHHEAERLLAVPQMSDAWKSWAQKRASVPSSLDVAEPPSPVATAPDGKMRLGRGKLVILQRLERDGSPAVFESPASGSLGPPRFETLHPASRLLGSRLGGRTRCGSSAASR